MKLSKSDILAVPHHQAMGFEDIKNFKATGISIDSRTVKAQDLFIAIRGGQFDGHNFISKAIEANAAGIVIERRWAELNATMLLSIHIPRLLVENTIHALGCLAKVYRRKYAIPVIAVGGSNGKTTTKEMITAVLSQKYRVLSTEGNLNNHIGVPQTLFRLDKKHEIAVLEIGTNHPGEIEYLCSIAEPTHGLITNIGREHLEFFNSLEGVAKAEGELFTWLSEHNGTCFVNADDEHLVGISKKIKKTIRYGLTARSISYKGTVKAIDDNANATVLIKQRGKKSFEIKLGVPGDHNVKNAVAAAAAGLALKVPSQKIQKALGLFSPASKRMQVQRFNDVTILNDTYNSNPDSTLAALSVLQEIKSSGKKVAILADMLELGTQSEELHRNIGKKLAEFGVDILITFGLLAKFIHDEAQVKIKAHFEKKSALCEYLHHSFTGGDIILVKGSRGMKMEEVVTVLQEQLSQKAGK